MLEICKQLNNKRQLDCVVLHESCLLWDVICINIITADIISGDYDDKPLKFFFFHFSMPMYVFLFYWGFLWHGLGAFGLQPRLSDATVAADWQSCVWSPLVRMPCHGHSCKVGRRASAWAGAICPATNRNHLHNHRNQNSGNLSLVTLSIAL